MNSEIFEGSSEILIKRTNKKKMTRQLKAKIKQDPKKVNLRLITTRWQKRRKSRSRKKLQKKEKSTANAMMRWIRSCKSFT